MDFDERVATIRREGHALLDAVEAIGFDAPVPACPEWRTADLVSHVGRIHRWVTSIVDERVAERPERHWSQAPSRHESTWFRDGVDALADVLLAAGPDASCWTWTPDHSAAFWARRQAAETSVHRVDAQQARGIVQPVERGAAIDAIDEFFWLIPYWPWADRVRGTGATLHIHCTDGNGEWFLRLQPDGVEVTREHAKGDVAARGTASELLCLLYGRAPVDTVDVFGDASVLTRFRELVSW
jgi:uncharacterized protein (TIGR03083 family)